jgi:hypothetical protein
LEQGEFKLKVRALEVERMMERNKIVQKNIFHSVLACSFLNLGVAIVSFGTGPFATKSFSRFIFGAAFILGSQVPLGLLELRKLDEYNKKYGLKKG